MPRSRLPVFAMVDAVEEDYRFETLPHSFGSERAQMVARKLSSITATRRISARGCRAAKAASAATTATFSLR